MSGKRKNTENSTAPCKLMTANKNNNRDENNSDSDEEYNYEDDKQSVGDNEGVDLDYTAADEDEDDDDNNNDNDDEEDDDLYNDDYFKHLEAYFPDDNSFLKETVQLNNSFSHKPLLSKAVPGTRKYEQIINSTPVLAAKMLTQNLKVINFQCVFMEPNVNNMTSFCIKTNSKKT